MGKNNTPKKKWALNEKAFALLLNWLDQDSHRAAEKYERLRQKLTLFFERRGCHSPDDLTDETFDRVARQLESGKVNSTETPAWYCYGVAQKILQEYWRGPSKKVISLDSEPSRSDSYPTATINPDDTLESDLNKNHLGFCLSQLLPEDRNLILKYYEGDHRQRITNRHELSLQLGISPGTLRIRALRIREQLSNCMNRCKNHGNGK